MAQLMPLPLTVSCFSKIQIGFTFLVPAYPGSPGEGAIKRVCVCVCVMVVVGMCLLQTVPLVTGNRYVVKTGTLTHVESRHSKLLWSPTTTDTKQLYLYVFTDLLLITKKKKYVIVTHAFSNNLP